MFMNGLSEATESSPAGQCGWPRRSACVRTLFRVYAQALCCATASTVHFANMFRLQ